MFENSEDGEATPPRDEVNHAASPALRCAIRAYRTISASNRTLLRASDETQLLQDMCTVAVEQGGYIRAGVVYADKGPGKKLVWQVWVGLEDGRAKYFSTNEINEAGYTWEDGPLGQEANAIAVRTERPFTRQNIAAGPIFEDAHYASLRRRVEQEHFMSLTAFPLACNDGVIGTLFMAAAEPDAFDEHEIELLGELAADLAYGIHTLRTRREHEQAQHRIRHLTFYDQQTGLLNRAGLLQLLRTEIEVARATRSALALLCIGVGRFPDICSVLGYTACEEVMQVLVKRLTAVIPDGAAVSSPGDGEFAVVLKNGSVDLALSTSQAVLAALSQPVDLAGALLDPAACIGIAVFPGHAVEPESMARRARAAMHAATGSHERISVYRAGQEQEAAIRLAMVSELRHAIQVGEFELYCQPKVEIETRRPCGAEALLRWRHPARGLISPASFIPLAEQGGLIRSITDWLLEAAFQQVYSWQEDGRDHPLSVNLSVHDLRDQNLVTRVRNLHSTWGIPPRLIQFELTESALMEDPESAMDTLTRLKDLGFGISIDDFGTGYSSLSYLHRFPVDAIKIDQSFVRPMARSQDSSLIVQATIDLGHDLGLHVIAEGVEDQAVWESLETHGCDHAQGYLVALPMPVMDLMKWDRGWRGKSAWRGAAG